LIQVDGGIDTFHAGSLKVAGADLMVIGTFLYNANNIENTINDVLNSINKSGD
jgi:ribulose-phosphate 3-epimerase